MLPEAKNAENDQQCMQVRKEAELRAQRFRKDLTQLIL